MSKAKLIREFVTMAKRQNYQEWSQYDIFISPKDGAVRRIKDLQTKLKTDDVDMSRMYWEYCDPGEATITYLGETWTYHVPADIYLVGDAVTSDGVTTRFFKKFVSHPFYQLGRVAYRTQPIAS